MEDFFDDFDDDYDEGEFMDEDSFEDNLEEDLEMDEPSSGDSEFNNEPEDTESQNDEFTAKDAFFLGGWMNWAYMEGVEETRRKLLLKEQSKRRKRNKCSDSD